MLEELPPTKPIAYEAIGFVGGWILIEELFGSKVTKVPSKTQFLFFFNSA